VPGRSTHYDVLGVRSDATPDEIRRAYLRLARELHPDRNPNDGSADELAMRDVNEAWRVLRDRASRDAYDRSLARPATAPAPVISEDDVVHPASFRSAVWLALILLVFAAIFVVTAYAGGGGSGRRSTVEDLVGRCVRIQVGLDVVEAPCDRPNDGEAVMIVDRASRCPRATAPHDVARQGVVLCLVTR